MTGERDQLRPQFAHLLTAGRTGSTYFTELFGRLYPEVAVFQEREPARVIGALNNSANLFGNDALNPARALAVSWYRHSRQKRLRHAAGSSLVVEINPFIVGLGTRLDSIKADKLVHLVRNPVGWVRSAVEFGSYSWRRPIVPFMPFVRERPPLGHANWRAWNDAEKFAWRWKYRNEQIRHFLETSGAPGIVVRYEDIFTRRGVNTDLLKTITAHIGLDPARLNEQTVLKEQVNPTLARHRRSSPGFDPAAVMAICGDEAARYGYGAAPVTTTDK